MASLTVEDRLLIISSENWKRLGFWQNNCWFSDNFAKWAWYELRLYHKPAL